MLFSTSLKRFAVVTGLAAAIIISGHAAPGEVERLRQSFINPPDDARIMMRWWWFGSAVTKPELEREMRVMKAGGIGGFEVQPVYPLELDDPQTGFVNLPYLSDGYLDALKFTAEKARELGLAHGCDAGQRLAVRRTAYAGHRSVGRAAVRPDRGPANTTSIPMPAIGNGEKFIAAFLAKGDRRTFEATGIQQLSKVERRTDYPAPGHRWQSCGAGVYFQPHRHAGEAARAWAPKVRARSLRSGCD